MSMSLYNPLLSGKSTAFQIGEDEPVAQMPQRGIENENELKRKINRLNALIKKREIETQRNMAFCFIGGLFLGFIVCYMLKGEKK